MKHFLFLFYAVLLVVPASTTAQNQETPSITSEQIAENLYVLYGGSGRGSHSGLFIGENGLLLIDTMLERTNDQLLAAIREISDKPIKHVITTHSDADHAGGTAFFKELGARIYMHENAQYEGVSADTYFKEMGSLNIGDEEIEVHHVVSHSFSDLIIYFKNSNAIFMGDTFTNSWYATFNSGGAKGQYEAIDLALSLSNEQTKIVPGHGIIANKEALRHYKDNTEKWMAHITQLYTQGLTPQQMYQHETTISIAHQFITPELNRTIPENRLIRFIERSVSADLTFTYPIQANQLNAYVGTFRYENGTTEEVYQQDDVLYIRKKTPYHHIAELIPISPTSFHLKGGIDMNISFEKDSKGRFAYMMFERGNVRVKARRLIEE